jgi:hypothetical protein
MNRVICKICDKNFKNLVGLNTHLRRFHPGITPQVYYDLYLKQGITEGICKICQERTSNFISINKGYTDICSHINCINQKIKNTKFERYGDENYNNTEKSKQTCLEKYGVNHPAKTTEVITKMQNTTYNNYGVINISQSLEWKKKIQNKWENKTEEDIAFYTSKKKATKLVKYGDENYNNSQKNRETCIKKYGVSNGNQIKESKDKTKRTKLERYGDENYTNATKMKKTKLMRYGNSSYVNPQKATQTCIDRYGVKRVMYLYSNKHSQISQNLFWEIYNKLPEDLQKECYFAELNQERFLNNNGRGFMYDFCILSKKIFIEFQGDYWHRNPQTYEYNLENLSVWLKDEFKKEVAEENGFKVFYVWESDYNNDKDSII